jgi:hypothetical protein
MAQYSLVAVADASSGNFVQLSSNVTHQVRMAINVGQNSLMALADSATNATNTSSQIFIRAGTSGPDFEICATPSRLWFRSFTTNASNIYAFAWTLENADLA